VGRRRDVGVQVELDPGQLLGRQGGDVVLRAEEPDLLAAEPDEPQLVKMTGIRSSLARPPLKTLVRPGLPSLKMIAADAPAASAFATFSAKVHVPRWINAMLPRPGDVVCRPASSGTDPRGRAG
jgi:hypothetical protein